MIKWANSKTIEILLQSSGQMGNRFTQLKIDVNSWEVAWGVRKMVPAESAVAKEEQTSTNCQDQ